MPALKSGYSLIELLVAVAILGILAAICYPSYQQYVLRSYRAEAITTLLQLANAQEQHSADHGVYAEDLSIFGLSPSQRYRFDVTISAAQQTFELTAQTHGLQQADTECQLFTLNNHGQRNQQAPVSVFCWE